MQSQVSSFEFQDASSKLETLNSKLSNFQTNSLARSANASFAILTASGSPRASDSANLSACLAVTLPGIGAVNGSTCASSRAGPGVARKRSTMVAQSLESST